MGLMSIAEDMISRWGTTVDLLVNATGVPDGYGNTIYNTNTYAGIPAYVGSYVQSDAKEFPRSNLDEEDIHVLLSRATPIHPDNSMRLYYANRNYRIISVRPVYARMGELLYFDIRAREDV